MHRATILCPDLIIISPNFKDYTNYSRSVVDRLREITPLVEQISIDEAFLDVTHLPDSAVSIGKKIQESIIREIGLPCSIGIATNKLVAKIATDKGKQQHKGNEPPNAITNVPPGTEKAFLATLPVQNLWGIGPKTAERLEKLGIKTIGDIADSEPHILTPIFGNTTLEIIERACGIDRRPVVLSHDIKSISQETTFAKDVSNMAILKRTILRLSETVGARLRGEKMYARTIKIKLRFSNFETITRQITLGNPTDQDREIFENAMFLLEKTLKNNKLIRLIGVGVSNLSLPVRQLSFWESSFIKKQNLQTTVDEIRKKYGSKILQLGGGLESNDE